MNNSSFEVYNTVGKQIIKSSSPSIVCVGKVTPKLRYSVGPYTRRESWDGLYLSPRKIVFVGHRHTHFVGVRITPRATYDPPEIQSRISVRSSHNIPTTVYLFAAIEKEDLNLSEKVGLEIIDPQGKVTWSTKTSQAIIKDYKTIQDVRQPFNMSNNSDMTVLATSRSLVIWDVVLWGSPGGAGDDYDVVLFNQACHGYNSATGQVTHKWTYYRETWELGPYFDPGLIVTNDFMLLEVKGDVPTLPI